MSLRRTQNKKPPLLAGEGVGGEGRPYSRVISASARSTSFAVGKKPDSSLPL